jgi:hypothetical protein
MKIESRGAAFAILLAPLLWAAQPADGFSYSANPIHATVVDSATGKPIPDVIVVTRWQLEDVNGHFAGNFHVDEAITNAQGEFSIPAWGPTAVPRDPRNPIYSLRMGPMEPDIILFKRGYQFGVEQGPWESAYLGDPAWKGEAIRTSYWNAKTIKLVAFSGSDEHYNRTLALSMSALPWGNCHWTRMPRMVAALVMEGNRLSYVQGFNAVLRLDELSEKEDGRYCGAAPKILGPYLK